MEISSDGSIDPKNALFLSAKILRDLYDKLVGFEQEPEYIKEVEMDPELDRLEQILKTNVNELELSVRCSNCLAAAKIDTIGELVSKTENEMLKYRNFGKKSLEEINSLLEKYDLSLGMDVDGIFNKIEKAKNKTNVMKKD
jgi:DNA-directed RNA polymerase subunit alpha